METNKRIVIVILLSFGLVSVFQLAHGQAIYKWIDEKGTVHFSEDPNAVPEKYESKVQKKDIDEFPPLSSDNFEESQSDRYERSAPAPVYPLPPPIESARPPEMLALPGTEAYVVPNVIQDIFFYDGLWWRLWEGRWYRSQYYDRGWSYYNNIPIFYYDVDPRWRGYYENHNWNGHPWNYERVSYQRFQQNWRSWQANRYWEKQGNWGIQGYQPRPQQQRQVLRQQGQQQYQPMPEVQRQEQQRQVQKPQLQQREEQQRQVQKPQVQQRQQQPQRQEPQRSQRRPEGG